MFMRPASSCVMVVRTCSEIFINNPLTAPCECGAAIHNPGACKHTPTVRLAQLQRPLPVIYWLGTNPSVKPNPYNSAIVRLVHSFRQQKTMFLGRHFLSSPSLS